MTPREYAAIESVIRDLEKMSLRRTALKLQALLGEPPMDEERPCPMQDHEAGNQIIAIPWGLAEILYPAYGHGQTLEELARRGGFGRGEIGMLAADCYTKGHPRLKRMPLLDLYDMARVNFSRQEN